MFITDQASCLTFLMSIQIYVYMCMCVCMYVYIYIYTYVIIYNFSVDVGMVHTIAIEIVRAPLLGARHYKLM